MRTIIAEVFRLLFQLKLLNTSHYFGIHERIFEPLNLFRGVVRRIKINQLQFDLHIDDWIQQNIYFLLEYERAELIALKSFLKSGGTCIDVGANFGWYSLNASRLIGDNGTCICFEPFSENFNSLTHNLAINQVQNIQAEKYAVGQESGSIRLYYDQHENNLGMVSTTPIENATEEEVEMVSIDSFLEDRSLSQIDLIKIDVEGFEYPALLGMRKTLVSYKPAILIEILEEDGSQTNSKNIHDFLYSLGYSKYFIDDQGKLSKTDTNPKRFNFIFATEQLAD